MEHTIRGSLHLDSESFRDLLQASSEDLKIPVQLIEKDYYISAILRALSKSTYSRQIVFKGGTSFEREASPASLSKTREAWSIDGCNPTLLSSR